MKLNPEHLEVETFATEATFVSLSTVEPLITDPNNPTPATYCFVCD